MTLGTAWRDGRPAIAAARALVPIALGSAVLLAPWIWRNVDFNGQLALLGSASRNRLLYLVERGAPDFDTPLMKRVNPERAGDYDLIHIVSREAGTPRAAERLAADLVWEQVLNRPAWFLREVARAVATFGGFDAASLAGNDRGALAWWLRHLVADPAALVASNERVTAGCRLETGARAPTRSIVTRLLRRAGLLYLQRGRLVLFGLFVLLLTLTLVRWARAFDEPPTMETAGMVLAYSTAVLAHAATLADADRFAVPFDAVLVPCVYLLWVRVIPTRRSPRDRPATARASSR
jgi:hypothetical protein